MLQYDRGRIGERSAPVINHVDNSEVRKFSETLGESADIYRDEDSARRAGYGGLVALPTFSVCLQRNPPPGLVMPKAGVIHGEQEFWYGAPICAGDRIAVTTWLDDVRVREGSRGVMTILTIGAEGQHANGDLAFRSRSVFFVGEGVT